MADDSYDFLMSNICFYKCRYKSLKDGEIVWKWLINVNSFFTKNVLE